MGGKALKEYGVDRVSNEKSDYIKSKLRNFVTAFNATYAGHHTEIYFPECWEKSDHGDVDVVVNTSDRTLFIKYITFVCHSAGLKRNGQCTSIEFQGAQVDLIFAKDDKEAMWVKNWYSWADMSAIIGRIIRPYGLKFGNDGLYYCLKSKFYNRSKHDMLLTNDFYTALKILGFNVNDYFAGFKSPEQLFKFLVNTRIFPKNLADLKTQRNARHLQFTFDQYVNDNRIVTNDYALNQISKSTIKYLEHCGPPYLLIKDNVNKIKSKQLQVDVVEKMIYPWYKPIKRFINKTKYNLFANKGARDNGKKRR